jgi:hypothetical protein
MGCIFLQFCKKVNTAASPLYNRLRGFFGGGLVGKAVTRKGILASNVRVSALGQLTLKYHLLRVICPVMQICFSSNKILSAVLLPCSLLRLKV